MNYLGNKIKTLMHRSSSSTTSINPCTSMATNYGTIQGIILRTSASLYSRYIYVSFPPFFPSVVSSDNSNAFFVDSLTTVPYFPDITILDSIGCNILYHTYSSYPDFFHVYNLINRSHFHFPFPYPFSYVNAAIIIHERIYFKVLVVCVEEHRNALFCEEKDDNSAKPLVFFVYSSKSKEWSCVRNPSSPLTSDQLLPNRRKPIHVDVDAVFLDLTDRFLIHFDSIIVRVDLLPKPVSPWENNSMKLDEATRYGECNGWLRCVKINPFNKVVEIWRMEALIGLWGLVLTGKINLRGKVLGLHPYLESSVFMRSEVNDEILLVDIKQDLRWVVVGGRGPKCGKVCFLRGMNDVFEAALEGGEKLQPSGCGILHPHENADGPEGEIFIVSISEMNLNFH